MATTKCKNIKSNDHFGWLIKLIKSDEGDIFIKDNKYSLYIDYNPIKKFECHRFFHQNEDYIILFDGIAFNKDELTINFKASSWNDTIIKLWQNEGHRFPLSIKGSFCGFIIDLRNKTLIIYSDHIGSHSVYYQIGESIKVSSDITKILDDNIKDGNNNYLDNNSAYALLSCGFMLDNNTLYRSIKKLTPGCCLRIADKYEEIPFYSINNDENNRINEKDAIITIDKLFRNAINYQYSSDLSGGGYFTALSGGLDSRMTSLIAHKLGFTRQLNFTFSQSNYLDQKIAESIASEYNHDWLFKSLDTGNYLLDVDEVTEFTGGLVLYYGLAHGNSFIKLLDLSNFGILHSGQLGDVIIGTFFKSNNPNESYTIKDGAFGGKLINKIDTSKLKQYKNAEIGKFHNRGFNGVLTAGHSVVQQSMETYSPFFDKEFMDFCLSLPLNLRSNHYIYKKWILNCYPEFGHYPWEKIKAKISTPTIKLKGQEIPITRLIPQIANSLKHKLFKSDVLADRHHMNPIAFHINNNPSVENFITHYYKSSIELIRDDELRQDIEKLIREGTSLEKVMVLTLLSAVKRFEII